MSAATPRGHAYLIPGIIPAESAPPEEACIDPTCWCHDGGGPEKAAGEPAPGPTCTGCGEPVTPLLADWADEDGRSYACCGDLSAPYVPHKPEEAA